MCVIQKRTYSHDGDTSQNEKKMKTAGKMRRVTIIPKEEEIA